MAKVFMQGNQAMAESAIRAGCKLFFGYPITPSSEVPEYYAKAMVERPEENITFIQAETEVSAFNMVAGAVATGHRAMTATSGPGFSLGQEAMSYMSAADLPAVIVEIMRAGPADGEILAAQGDYFQAVKGGGHGDYNNLVLAPYSVQEYCDMIQESFELAEKYHNPVILLSDATIAKMRESVELPAMWSRRIQPRNITRCGAAAARSPTRLSPVETAPSSGAPSMTGSRKSISASGRTRSALRAIT